MRTPTGRSSPPGSALSAKGNEMNPRNCVLFFCGHCGWGVCVSWESDLNQKYLRSRQRPNCPYCKVRISGAGFSATHRAQEWHSLVREPVVLQVPPRLRREILKKYAGTCAICGSKENPQIDHIVPTSCGGTAEPDNLQVLCQRCNGSKGAGDDISKKREMALLLKAALVGYVPRRKRLSMAEVSRVTGVKYAIVLACQDALRKELEL